MAIVKAHAGATVLLIVLQAVLTLPYLLGGPLFMREDWEFLGHHYANDPHVTDADTASLRPLVTLLFDVVYPLAADSPTFVHVVQTVVVGAVALALYALLQRHTARGVAAAVAAVWLVLPTHLTLDHWIAAFNIPLAMLVAILGLLVVDLKPNWPGIVTSAVLVSIAALLYEATYPVVVVVGIVLLWKRWSGDRRKVIAGWVFLLLPVAAFIALRAGQTRNSKGVSIAKALYENFGIVHAYPNVMIASISIFAIAFAVALYRLVRRQSGMGERWMMIGLALTLVGVAPFLANGYDVMFVGVGDRANVVSSVGVAIAVVGMCTMCVGHVRRVLVVVGVFVVVMVPVHVATSLDWLDASRSVAEAGDRLISESHGTSIVLIDDGRPVPGADLGLNAAVELKQRIESGWRSPAVRVEVQKSDVITDKGAASILESM